MNQLTKSDVIIYKECEKNALNPIQLAKCVRVLIRTKNNAQKSLFFIKKFFIFYSGNQFWTKRL